MRILIVGAGAVGGYFGSQLIAAGADVTFLVRPAKAEQLFATGLVIIDPEGRRETTHVTTVTADSLGVGWDLILLAVKATALDGALADISPAVTRDTAILPFLNGIDHLETLSNRFGRQHVLGGVAVVAAELTEHEEIALLAPGASIGFGELDGHMTDRVSRIANSFAPAALESSVSDSIIQDMWEKWHFMAAGGAATTLLGGSVGQIVSTPGGLQSIERIIDEASAIQQAEGHSPRAAALSRTRAILTQPGSGFTTSMYRDFAARRRTEGETILGSLLFRGAEHEIATPLLEAATVKLRIFDAIHV